MSPSNNFITRPVLTTVCSLLIVIVGLICIPILPVENLPDIAPPTVQVKANYSGADAVSVEEGVTNVLEQQINGVQNMEFITSNSAADGSSSITVSFASGTDGDINQVNVQNRVALAAPQIPRIPIVLNSSPACSTRISPMQFGGFVEWEASPTSEIASLPSGSG
jgi:HAE1 family hydrophobic/amphiphilic exporter-1